MGAKYPVSEAGQLAFQVAVRLLVRHTRGVQRGVTRQTRLRMLGLCFQASLSLLHGMQQNLLPEGSIKLPSLCEPHNARLVLMRKNGK